MFRIALLIVFAVTAAYFDFRYRLVPNSLVLCCLCAGILLALTGGLDAFSHYGLGFILGLLLLLPAFVFNMVGGGDVKSMAIIGLLAGPHLLWISFLRGSILTGILGFLMIATRVIHRKSKPVPSGKGDSGKSNSRASIPYAGILALTAALSAFI
jgi:Flp pilus assembly protein protease CpaA